MRKRRIVRFATEMVLLVGFVYGILAIEATGGGISSDNLVLNGSFEILMRARGAWIEDLKPESWKESAEGGWEVDMVDSQRGNNSLKATTAWSWLSQEIKVKAGRYYVLEAYIRSDITIPDKEDYANTFLTLECLNWRKKVIQRDWGIVNATSSWQLRENAILVPPGTEKIRIKLAKREGEGSVWFDRVKIMQSLPNLVLNSGFEVLDNSGKPNLWQEDSKAGWSSDSEGSYEGESSMRASVAWNWLSQEIPVTSRGYYVLKTYARSDIAVSEKEDYGNTFLTLECLNKEREVVKRDWGIVNATSSWQLKENLIFTPPDTRKIRIRLAKRQGEGSVWFDEVKVINISLGPILNPGFEILNEVGKPRFWKEHPQGGWEVSGEEVYEGNWAMRATRGWSWLSQEVPVEAKRWYSLAVQVKSDITLKEKTDYENTFLTIECLDKEDEVIKRQWGNAIAFAFPLWHQRENVIYTPENTRKMRIKLAKRLGEGSVWFDDVKLTERLFLVSKLPDKLTPLFNVLMYFLLVFSFVTVVIKIRSRKNSRKLR